MRSHHRAALALAISLAFVPAAVAQSSGSANPVARSPSGDVFFYQPLQGQARSATLGRDVFENTGIGRPNRRNNIVHPITPVPEPSQWAMMLAGLALVGFVVRRNSRRDP
jgi:hypothetical protein